MGRLCQTSKRLEMDWHCRESSEQLVSWSCDGHVTCWLRYWCVFLFVVQEAVPGIHPAVDTDDQRVSGGGGANTALWVSLITISVGPDN